MNQRCLVVASGFFNWSQKNKPHLPYFTKHMDEKLMLLAGLWERTTLEGDKYPTYTYTLITVNRSNALSSAFGNGRMPVILRSDEHIKLWLDRRVGWKDDVAELLRTYESPLTTYRVKEEVGNVKANDPSLVQPIVGRPDGIEPAFRTQMQVSQGKAERNKVLGSAAFPIDLTSALPTPSGSNSPNTETVPSSSAVGASRGLTVADVQGKGKKRARRDVEPGQQVISIDEESEELSSGGGSSPKRLKWKVRAPSPSRRIQKKTKRPRKKKSPSIQPGSKITDYFY